MNEIEHSVPEQWRGFVRVLTYPMQLLMPASRYLINQAWHADVPAIVCLKVLFLLLPILTVVVGLWSMLTRKKVWR